MKVALSGLFGRFVARAYLECYFDLSVFAHLGNRVVDLDRRKRAKIERLARGDLPDWIACKVGKCDPSRSDVSCSDVPPTPEKRLHQNFV